MSKHHRFSLMDAVIASKIRALRLPQGGFGGQACFEAAETINQRVFHGKGKIVGVANVFWLDRGRFLGHVAVEYGGRYWDADARPKAWASATGEDISSWGMLAPDDPDYFADGFDEAAADKMVKLDEQAVRKAFQK